MKTIKFFDCDVGAAGEVVSVSESETPLSLEIHEVSVFFTIGTSSVVEIGARAACHLREVLKPLADQSDEPPEMWTEK